MMMTASVRFNVEWCFFLLSSQTCIMFSLLQNLDMTPYQCNN